MWPQLQEPLADIDCPAGSNRVDGNPLRRYGSAEGVQAALSFYEDNSGTRMCVQFCTLDSTKFAITRGATGPWIIILSRRTAAFVYTAAGAQVRSYRPSTDGLPTQSFSIVFEKGNTDSELEPDVVCEERMVPKTPTGYGEAVYGRTVDDCCNK